MTYVRLILIAVSVFSDIIEYQEWHWDYVDCDIFLP